MLSFSTEAMEANTPLPPDPVPPEAELALDSSDLLNAVVCESSAPPLDVGNREHPHLPRHLCAGYADPVVVTHESEGELQAVEDWEPFHEQREMRNGEGRTIWYRTCGPFMLDQPPSLLVADVDELYVHHDRTSRTRMWVLNCSKVWIRVREGDRQPSDKERQLYVCMNSDFSWITRSSYSVARTRRKKARLADKA